MIELVRGKNKTRRVWTVTLAAIAVVCWMLFQQPVLGADGDPVAAPASVPGQHIKAQELVSRFQSSATPKKERLKALGELHRAKEALSKEDQLEFWRGVRAVASDKATDAQLRAETIWTLGSLGILLRHEKTLSDAEIGQQCRFLLDTAADESEPLRVRRMSINALGNLQMKEAVPVLKTLLADKVNQNRPEIGRSACVSLAELAGEEAVQPVGEVLGATTNSAVFGSAAYALGRTKSIKALPLLVANRSRLGDNLSVDNAVQELFPDILEALKRPVAPGIADAINATRSLWREEQKAEFRPLLEKILADNANSVEVRRMALHRLIDDAYLLPIPEAQKRLAVVLPLIEKDAAFDDERARIQQILNAKPAKPIPTGEQQ